MHCGRHCSACRMASACGREHPHARPASSARAAAPPGLHDNLHVPPHLVCEGIKAAQPVQHIIHNLHMEARQHAAALRATLETRQRWQQVARSTEQGRRPAAACKEGSTASRRWHEQAQQAQRAHQGGHKVDHWNGHHDRLVRPQAGARDAAGGGSGQRGRGRAHAVDLGFRGTAVRRRMQRRMQPHRRPTAPPRRPCRGLPPSRRTSSPRPRPAGCRTRRRWPGRRRRGRRPAWRR